MHTAVKWHNALVANKSWKECININYKWNKFVSNVKHNNYINNLKYTKVLTNKIMCIEIAMVWARVLVASVVE